VFRGYVKYSVHNDEACAASPKSDVGDPNWAPVIPCPLGAVPVHTKVIWDGVPPVKSREIGVLSPSSADPTDHSPPVLVV